MRRAEEVLEGERADGAVGSALEADGSEAVAAVVVAVAAAAMVAGLVSADWYGGVGMALRALKARRVIMKESLVTRKCSASLISLVNISEGLITPGM